MAVVFRPLTFADLPCLAQLDFGYRSDAELALERVHDGLVEITWRLTLRPLDTPYDKGHGYDLKEEDLQAAHRRLEAGNCLEWVAEESSRVVGLLEVEPHEWRGAGWIWNILIDRSFRRRGIGRQFIQRSMEWGRDRGLLALVAETQAQNIQACRFYASMGFVAGGVDDRYYRYCPEPQATREAALFWYLELDDIEAD